MSPFWLTLIVPVAFIVGVFFGLNARSRPKYDHRDKYLGTEDD